MRRNSIVLINIKSDGMNVISIGVGIKRTISMSKTIKITARRKNRIENGDRDDRIGSNPHSNGDNFSRLFVDECNIVINDRMYTRNGTSIAVIDEIIISFIYLKYKFSYD